MKIPSRAVLTSSIVLALSTSVLAATFQGLGLGAEPNSYQSEANALSADGSAAAGLYSVTNGGSHSFRWTACTGMVRLYGLPGVAQDPTNAYDVSGNGSVVVGGNGGGTFRWTQATGLSFLGVYNPASATVVSDDGTVILGYGRLTGPFSPQVGFIKVGNGPVTEFDFPDIFAINAISRDNTTVVGGSGEADKWDVPSGTYVALDDLDPNFADSSAGDISADGTVIVGISAKHISTPTSHSETHLVTWTGANNTINDLAVLDTMNGGGAYAFATNADGSIIVGSAVDRTGPAVGYAFIWDQAHGVRNLQNVLTNDYGLGSQLTGWQLFDATGISDDGKVIIGDGNYIDPNDPNLIRHQEAWIVTLYDAPTLTCGGSNTYYNGAPQTVSLPLSGGRGVESRNNDGTGGSNHTFVFGFTSPVSSVDSINPTCGTLISNGVDTSNPNLYDVQLDATGCNQQYVTVTLTGVHYSSNQLSSKQRLALDQTIPSASVTAGLLFGDVNGNGFVTNADVSLVKAQVAAGGNVDATNYRTDVNGNGVITNADVSLVKTQVAAGAQLPTPP